MKTTTNQNNMRVAIYARISPKPEGAVGDNYSIASQFHHLRQKSLEFGCAQPDEYTDKNFSGASLDRPELDRLRSAIARREYDVLIAYCPDRLSRDLSHSLILIQEIEKGGCTLAFVQGAYD